MADAWPMIEQCMKLQTVLEMTQEERAAAGLIGCGEDYRSAPAVAEAQVERDYTPLQSQTYEERLYAGGHHIDGTVPIIEPPHPVKEAWFR